MLKQWYGFFLITALCGGMTLPAPAWAQDGDIPEARMKTAREMVAAMEMDQMLMEAFREGAASELRHLPNGEHYVPVVVEFFKEHIGVDYIKEILAEFYAREFSESELEKIAEWSRTPVFMKLMNKMPLLQQQSSGRIEQEVQAKMPILEKMLAETEAKLNAQDASEADPDGE